MIKVMINGREYVPSGAYIDDFDRVPKQPDSSVSQHKAGEHFNDEWNYAGVRKNKFGDCETFVTPNNDVYPVYGEFTPSKSINNGYRELLIPRKKLKYKVGDKVWWDGNIKSENFKPIVGKLKKQQVTVESANNSYPLPYRIRLSDGFCHCVYEDQLSPLPETEFSVGQLIMLLSPDHKDTGEIHRIIGFDGHLLKIDTNENLLRRHARHLTESEIDKWYTREVGGFMIRAYVSGENVPNPVKLIYGSGEYQYISRCDGSGYQDGSVLKAILTAANIHIMPQSEWEKHGGMKAPKGVDNHV
jgi:hypothetical protein